MEDSFSPKSLFLAFRKEIESLGDALTVSQVAKVYIWPLASPLESIK